MNNKQNKQNNAPMRIMPTKLLLLAALMIGSSAFAQTSSTIPDAIKKLHDESERSKGQPTLIVDPANLPQVTRFIFLETKTNSISRNYWNLVDSFVRTIAAQPGFRASMTLADIDNKRMVIYYQFNSQAQYDALRATPPASLMTLANSLQEASIRFEDFGTMPSTQIPAGTGDGPPTPVPGYYAEFHYGDGVGINEAVANPGRTQAEVTFLMQHAGLRGATPQESPGFKEFTFHMGLDTDRNMNLLRYDTVHEMTVAALYTLSQGLINAGGTGGDDWYGLTGPAKLGLHVYSIQRIYNGKRF